MFTGKNMTNDSSNWNVSAGSTFVATTAISNLRRCRLPKEAQIKLAKQLIALGHQEEAIELQDKAVMLTQWHQSWTNVFRCLFLCTYIDLFSSVASVSIKLDGWATIATGFSLRETSWTHRELLRPQSLELSGFEGQSWSIGSGQPGCLAKCHGCHGCHQLRPNCSVPLVSQGHLETGTNVCRHHTARSHWDTWSTWMEKVGQTGTKLCTTCGALWGAIFPLRIWSFFSGYHMNCGDKMGDDAFGTEWRTGWQLPSFFRCCASPDFFRLWKSPVGGFKPFGNGVHKVVT